MVIIRLYTPRLRPGKADRHLLLFQVVGEGLLLRLPQTKHLVCSLGLAQKAAPRTPLVRPATREIGRRERPTIAEGPRDTRPQGPPTAVREERQTAAPLQRIRRCCVTSAPSKRC